MNVLDLNTYAESFYCEIINLIFGYNVKNANIQQHNNSGYDLIDSEQRIIIQVTSNTGKSKVKNTVELVDKQQYSGYTLVMLYIGGRKYKCDNQIQKEYLKDIRTWYKEDILSKINSKGIEEQKNIYLCFKNYFDKGDGNLALDVISKEIEIRGIDEIDDNYYFDMLYANRINYFKEDIVELEQSEDLDVYSLCIELQNVGNKAIKRIIIKEFTIVDSLCVDEGEMHGSVYCSHVEKKCIESLIPIGQSAELIIDFFPEEVYLSQSDDLIQICIVLDMVVSERETEECCIRLILEKNESSSKEEVYLEGKYVVKYKKIY